MLRFWLLKLSFRTARCFFFFFFLLLWDSAVLCGSCSKHDSHVSSGTQQWMHWIKNTCHSELHFMLPPKLEGHSSYRWKCKETECWLDGAEVPETVEFNLMAYILHSLKSEVNFDICLFHNCYLHSYIDIHALSLEHWAGELFVSSMRPDLW